MDYRSLENMWWRDVTKKYPDSQFEIVPSSIRIDVVAGKWQYPVSIKHPGGFLLHSIRFASTVRSISIEIGDATEVGGIQKTYGPWFAVGRNSGEIVEIVYVLPCLFFPKDAWITCDCLAAGTSIALDGEVLRRVESHG